MVFFTGATAIVCGTGQTAMGPFYCPEDQKVYLVLIIYRRVKKRQG